MGKRQSFDLPICSERRTASLCNRDCEAGNLLETCECLYDADVTDSTPPDGMLGEMPCPDGQICCFNMPCSRITTGSAGDCQAAGGADANGEGGNCELAIVDNQLECTCRAPLETVENPDLFAPYDCTCPFISDAEWLAQGGTGECIDDGTGNNEPTEGLSKAAIRRASLRLASLLQDLNVDEFKERCPTYTLRVTGKAAERICMRLEKLFNKFKVPTVKKWIQKAGEKIGCDFALPDSCGRGASLLAESELTQEELASVEPFTVIDRTQASASSIALACASLLAATIALF